MKRLTLLALCLISSIALAADGFLSEDELPDSSSILAPFPDMDPASGDDDTFYPNFAEDEMITNSLFKDGKLLNGSKVSFDREEQAKLDSNKSEDYYIEIFVNPLNIPNKEKVIQELKRTHIIERVTKDAKNSTSTGKDTFQRERPYAYYNMTSCIGDTKDSNPKKAIHSYPSAHTTRGMVVAHVLADMLDNPDDENHIVRKKILARGMIYGDNRVLCGSHWRSDIEAGRILAAIVHEKLKNNEEFKKESKDIQDLVRLQ